MNVEMNRCIKPRMNALESTMTFRLRDFVRMFPPIFLGYKMGEYAHEILDGFYKVLCSIGVNYREKAELASYQLREVSQVWYGQWKDNSLVESGPTEREEFKKAFLGKYFPRKKNEFKIEDFINLRKGNMSVEE